MICVVPLAGPDFERADGGLKPLIAVEGQPLLRRALESRRWWRSGDLRSEGLVFVLRDSEAGRAFARVHLSAWYPGARILFLSAYTGGAALSALAGVALTAHEDRPVCVDLADILFDDETGAAALFAADARAGGLGLWFEHDSPLYSYFELDEAGLVRRVREKQVISRCASAGVYLFRAPQVYIAAVAHSLAHRETLAHKDLMFVAPTLNGVIEAGWDVHAARVDRVVDLKIEVGLS